MMGLLGMVFQTESPVQHGVIGHCALFAIAGFRQRAWSAAPFGFWDPDGLTANGHVDSFMHYRSAEPKHGRIGMMTSMGYIPPDLSGRRLDIGRHR